MIAPTILLAAMMTVAVPRSMLRVPVARVNTRRQVVALTFDACATLDQDNSFDRPVFDILKREHVPATVFVSGRWIEVHPGEARELAADPDIEMGNHGYAHQHMAAMKGWRVTADIQRTEALVRSLGRESVALRPPFGEWSDTLIGAAAARTMPTVLWDVVSADAGGHVPAAKMVNNVSHRTRPGSIIIFHINGRGPYTKDALPDILKNLRARGFTFVPLSELLSLPGARPIKAPPMKRGRVISPSMEAP